MATVKKIAVLPGDGIGPEVVSEAQRVIKFIGEEIDWRFDMETVPFGGAAIDEKGEPFPESTKAACDDADAVLLGAVGGPKWDSLPGDIRPEKGLLNLRKHLDLYANLRPAIMFDCMKASTSFKEEVVEGVDLMVVRELTGGIYFGKKYREEAPQGTQAVDTLVYTEKEIERILHRGFEIAQKRRKNLTSVDKANVLESSRLWREVCDRVAKAYPDVTYRHMLVDNCAMQLVYAPKQFDVIVTENMFGDILSDEASMLTGSIGMLPSASLSDGGKGLYEPVHGSAPDIAGQGKANPIATILSVGMMMTYSFGLVDVGRWVEQAVQEVLKQGFRTADIAKAGESVSGTKTMTDAIIQAMKEKQAK